MKISFFEEFPTKEKLDKVNLCEFDTNLYVRADSVKDFLTLERQIEKEYENVKKVAYWVKTSQTDGPIISASGFLKENFKEIKTRQKPITILWDSAPMHSREPKIWQHERMIQRFYFQTKIEKKGRSNWGYYNNSNYTFEDLKTNNVPNPHSIHYKALNTFFKTIFLLVTPRLHSDKQDSSLKVPAPSKIHPTILMTYNGYTLDKDQKEFLLDCFSEGQKVYGPKLKAGIGLITEELSGIQTELTLSPKELKKELKKFEKLGINETVIYNLGGLNPSYAKVINSSI